jgi:cell division protein FtsI/penicillin-binding protein 2
VVEFKANKISVVVMNPKTGAIMAMASNPRFDPNTPGEAYELEKVNYAKFPNPAVDLL